MYALIHRRETAHCEIQRENLALSKLTGSRDQRQGRKPWLDVQAKESGSKLSKQEESIVVRRLGTHSLKRKINPNRKPLYSALNSVMGYENRTKQSRHRVSPPPKRSHSPEPKPHLEKLTSVSKNLNGLVSDTFHSALKLCLSS